MSLKNRPLPTIAEDSERFWASNRERAMELQKCDDCSKLRYYPGPICHDCGSDRFTWVPVSGKGTIYSWTLLERARGNPFEEDLPIAILLVTLEEGPVMMSNLLDYEEKDLRIGAPVMIGYEDISPDVTLPIFRPVRAA